MRKIQRVLLTAIVGAVLTVACSREYIGYNPNQESVTYQKSWQDKYGQVDEGHTWNIATQATARINLDGQYTVRIYNENPISGNARLLAKTQVNRGEQTLQLDLTVDATMVFVTAENEDEKAVNGYLPISNGQILIGVTEDEDEDEDNNDTRAATTESCPTTIGAAVIRTMNNKRRQENGTGDWKEYDFTETLYQLQNVTANTNIEPWKSSDFRALFGEDGLFPERQDNLERHGQRLAADVEYVMQETGPVTLTLSYCLTTTADLIGYYYWHDGEDPAQARKFLLTSNPPSSYIALSHNNGKSYQPLTANTDFLSWNNNSILVRGTAFRLAYFDGMGRASYNFPRGTHIAFFIDRNGYYDYLFNSLERYNDWTRAYYSMAYHKRAVTYNLRGTTILSFENGTDFDENDVVLLATGNFKKPIDLETGREPSINDDNAAPQTWIIACEDLSTAGDYDFNDVVFSVSHVAGQSTATITPLAAGSHLPANILMKSQDLGEVHQLLQPGAEADETNNYELMNTNASRGTPGESITLNVPGDFCLSYSDGTNMGGMAICVLTPDERTGGQRAMTIGAPTSGSTPQMILVPDTWLWPIEGKHIETAYPEFSGWSKNANHNTSWYNACIKSQVVH